MKFLLTLAFVSVALSGIAEVFNEEVKKTAHSIDEVADFIGGIVAGVGTEINAPDILPCISNADELSDFIEKSFADFSKHTHEGTLEGLINLSRALSAIPEIIQKCVPASAEVGIKIEQIVQTWNSPLRFFFNAGKNIVFNGVEIFKNLSEAMNAYKEGNLRDFGFNIGQAAFELIETDSSGNAKEVKAPSHDKAEQKAPQNEREEDKDTNPSEDL